jgi:hypothetical protein
MYRIAGIDVHKKKLAVEVSDVEAHGEYQFERCWFGANPEQLRFLSQWLAEHPVEEVVARDSNGFSLCGLFPAFTSPERQSQDSGPRFRSAKGRHEQRRRCRSQPEGR